LTTLIKRIDHKVFEDVLKYIYTGEASNIDDHTEELLAAADQYQQEKLKELFEVKLCSKLVVSNCIDLVLLGDLHHASTLKPASLNFVSKNLGSNQLKWVGGETEGKSNFDGTSFEDDVVKAVLYCWSEKTSYLHIMHTIRLM